MPDRHYRPLSYFKRLPRSGKSLGMRFLTLLRLPVFILLTVFVHGMIFAAAWLFYVLELGTNPKLYSFLDAVFWSVATITTVGYGDIVPVTDHGKILAIFTMIFGSLCIVLYTAFFAGALIAPELALVEKKVKDMEDEVKEFGKEIKTDDEIQRDLLHHLETLIKKLSVKEPGPR